MKTNTVSASRMPDAFVILFFVVLAAWLLTFFVPAGSFDVEMVDGRQAIVANSFKVSDQAQSAAPLFAEGGQVGFFNFAFEGMVSGDKWGSAIGVMMFILITGGAFGIMMSTGSIHRGMLAFIEKTRRFESLFLPLLFLVFSLGGAVFGMGEEAIAFCLVLHPLMTSLGHSPVITVFVTYVATQVGFACSWMNPFSVAIAQGIAGIPLLSGSGFRMAMWAVFTLVGMAMVSVYSRRLRQNSPATNNSVQTAEGLSIGEQAFDVADKAVFAVFIAAIVWVVWGVVARGYYIPEIASQFFTMGIAVAIVAVISKKQSINQCADAFKSGAQQLLPAALIVGMAKGIVLVLGGDKAGEDSVLNTLLFYASEMSSGTSESVSALFMLAFQSVFNFFIASGSGQAALTMPLMAPLADLLGMSRQIAVLAFQLGDGLTNIFIPTSASLIGCLGAVGLDWSQWAKFALKVTLIFLALAAAFMLLAVGIQYS